MLGNRENSTWSQNAMNVLKHDGSVVDLAQHSHEQHDVHTARAQWQMFGDRGQQRNRQVRTRRYGSPSARQHIGLRVEQNEFAVLQLGGNGRSDDTATRADVENTPTVL